MPTICTIGHTQKTLKQFIQLLRDSRVDAVIDIRLRNTSQLAGFAKRDDLAFLLREGFDIEYEHHPELAPTAEILDTYKREGDWTLYKSDCHSLMAKREAGSVGRELLARFQRPCLLCSEPTPDHCHRRLVAEMWAELQSYVEVIHLT